MSNVGSASLLIVPKFDGLSAKVNGALAGVDVSSGSRAMGARLAGGVSRGVGGLAKSGAIIGTFSAATGKAMDLIGAHVGSAVARLDTMKNYPKVMGNLGASASEADSSISLMSDHLDGLPTTLDAMASTVQGIWAATKKYGTSLGDATKAGLGLNDMLLAGGASTAVANAAMEQFRQMLSKSKPDMQDWKSLISAAPAQMDQLAKSMLGPTASADDLYAALGGGKHQATKSMTDLLDAISRLDTEGGAGLSSFRDQAMEAQKGIETSFENLGTAVTKGISGVLDTVGRDNIVGVIDSIKSDVKYAFDDADKYVKDFGPQLGSSLGTVGGVVQGAFRQTMGTLERLAPKATSAVTAITDGIGRIAPVASKAARAAEPLIPVVVGLAAAGKGLTVLRSVGAKAVGALSGGLGTMAGVSSRASNGLLEVATACDGRLSEGLLNAAGGFESLAGFLSGPWALGIAAGVAGVAVLAGALTADLNIATQHEKALGDAVSGLNDQVSRTDGLSSYSGAVDGLGGAAQGTAVDMDTLATKLGDHARAMRETNDAAQASIGQLSQAQKIIDESAGKTDLDTDAKGRLTWALKTLNDQLGINISSEDVMADRYADENGNVQELKSSIDDLIAKKKDEIRVNAISSNLTEAYKAQSESASALAGAQRSYNDALQESMDKIRGDTAYKDLSDQQLAAIAATDESVQAAKKDLDAAQGAYDSASNAVSDFSSQLDNAAAAAGGASTAMRDAVNAAPLLVESFSQAGKDTNQLSDALDQLGVSSDDVASISAENAVRLAADFDGSAGSIVQDLQDMGVKMNDTAAMTASLAGAIGVTADAWSADLARCNISADDFANAMSSAGLSAQDMAGISESEFQAMADSCGGDINRLIGMIATYNHTPIIDQNGTITVDDTRLVDAQGNVYVWNGSTLAHLDGSAVVDDVDLVDAQGNVVRWDKSKLISMSADAVVNGNAADGSAKRQVDDTNGSMSAMRSKSVSADVGGNARSAAGGIWDTVNAINALTSKEVRVVTRYETTGVNPGGGTAKAKLMAHGGVRTHADGFIAKGPTWISPNDLIGENGAEYYDGKNIVPLTNTHYSRPFARIIGQETVRALGALGGMGGPVVNQNVRNEFYGRDDMYVDAEILSRSLMRAAGGV